MGQVIDLTNQRFGRWTVIGRGPIKVSKNGASRITWHCICDCGNEANVVACNLRGGKSVSCGCLRREKCSSRMKKINTMHGDTYTRLFRIWNGIKTRCYNKNATAYPNYGGRGITMCEEWKIDFTAFRDWAILNGYEEDLTCERINNNMGYFPDNCRWISRAAQQKNKRTSRFLTLDGESHVVSEWAEITGIHKDTILKRLESGWTVEKALTEIWDARKDKRKR